MLSNFAEKKETFFDLTKMNFLNSSKTHFLTFGQKMPFFFLYIDLIKIRLEIILSDFAGKKENFFGPKKTEFFKAQKVRFSKGVSLCFSSKNAIFSLFRFGQHKTRNNG